MHATEHSRPVLRVARAAVGALLEFLTRKQAIVALGFVVLYKLPNAFAGDITSAFVIDIGFSRNQYAAIVKGLGVAAVLLGGFVGGFIARASPLALSLWIGGVLQAVAVLAYSWLAILGPKPAALAFAISAEHFASAIGTIIFVAYQAALCRNPLHTATQFALLTALSAVARTFLSADAGYVAKDTGWPLFFAISASLAIPGLLLLGWLQRGGHFAALETDLATERGNAERPAAA
jgi:MFS transporter, PAT family, beta-lactamase induction signal transducer AmpG